METKDKLKVYIEKAGNMTKDGIKAIRDVCSSDTQIEDEIEREKK